MICSKCGKEFEGRFCPWCGAAGEESEKASAADKIAAEEELKEEAPKDETPKAEETAKAEAPKEETPKEEAPKAEEEKKIAEQAATEEKAEGSAGAGKIKCPKCGNVFSGKFCTECGYKAAELDKCPVCGAPHKAGDKFCAECGYSYEKKPNAAAATVAGIGTAIKNSCKNALAFCKKHSKKVIAAAVVVALILVIVVPISVVFTSPVQPANVDRIKIGDTQERVLSILGDPYDWKEGDTTFEYYSDNYLKIKKELDKISNMEDMESFGDFADALEKEEELNAKLETLEYKETTISFDEDGLVTKVVYNACVSESEEQAKEIKSKEVLTESIRVYEKSEVVYTIKYTDKSIVKAIAQVTPDTLLDEYAFSIYDPFAPENKIELSCKVVENSDVTAISEGNCQYRLDQYGKLTISGTGEVTKEGINRLSESSIKEVIIEEGVTGIGEEAFASCGSMTSVSIPDSITSVGKDAFANTSVGYTTNGGVRYLGNETNKYLVAIQIGAADTIQFNIHGNCKVIADSAFEGNETLKAAYIPEGSVKYIGARAFYGCMLITGVTLGNGVENIGDAVFCGCDSLTSITIPGSVTNIGASAFSGCDSLTNITISEGVTSIGDYAFDSCFELQNISIPSSLETVGNRIFNYVNKVTRIDFDGDLAAWLKVMSLGGMASVINSDSMIYFNGEQLSGDIVIPEGITSIPSYAFTNSTQITSLTIPDSVTSIGSYILQGCTGIESLTIPEMTRMLGGYFGEDPSKYYNTKVSASLKTVTITGGESIPAYAFDSCSSLTSITIPSSVTSIGNSAFSGCSSLTSTVIPDSVTSIGSSAFYNCSSLTSIVIPDSVTSIGSGAFSYTNLMQKENGVSYVDKWVVDCDSSVKQVQLRDNTVGIAGGAFYNCSSLTSITIPDCVTSIGRSVFEGCNSLKSIVIPEGVTSIGDYAFEDCSSLKSIIIPDSVTSIGYQAFYNCSSLTSITIPEGVTNIGNEAFAYCSSLISIVIPEGVTNIGYRLFYSCDSLASITIPDSVTSIGSGAFGYCNVLTIYCEVSSKPSGWGNDWNFSDHPVVWDCNNNDVADDGNVYCIHNGIRYTLKEGKATVVRQPISLSGEIVLPKSISYKGSAYNVASIGSIAFYGCESLTSITIPDSVTGIESSAFSGCSSLTSITIPDSVTSIGWGAFVGCELLTSITIPDSVTSIGDLTFDDCSSLTIITIPDSVTSIGNYAFRECSSLTSITIPNSVTNIGKDAFYNCDSLTSITIPDSVTSIGNSAFSGCDSLASITIPDSVTSIGSYAFWSCDSLASITIPDSVTSIGSYAFYNCSLLKEVYISDIAAWCAIEFESDAANPLYYGAALYLNGELVNSIEIPKGVTSIGSYAFYNCDSLTSITIPESVTSIGSYAFYNCDSLTSITIPESVTSIGSSAFKGCSGLTSITIPFIGSGGSSNTHFGYIFGASSYSYNDDYVPSSLREVVITGGTSIGRSAFYGCESLTSITIPDSVTSIGSSAFCNCSSLTSIIIPDSVTSIGSGAFWSCGSLTSIIIPDSVTSIGEDAFYNCDSLTSIIIPDSVTSIGEAAFLDCSSLTWDCNNNDVADDDYIYYIHNGTRYALKEGEATVARQPRSLSGEVVLPESVAYKGNTYRVTSIGDYAFYWHSSLTSITIPEGVTSIGSYAFQDCDSLTWDCNNNDVADDDYIYYIHNGTRYALKEGEATVAEQPRSLSGEVVLPKSISYKGNTYSVTSMEYGAFSGCRLLTSITIPDSVTSIGDHAFIECSSLTSITIPDSVTSIGDWVFSGCRSLTSINFQGTMAQWKAIDKGRDWMNDTGSFTVTCTDGTLDKNGNQIS